MAETPYGSGHFGEWIEDEFGLPAYRYTCDQVGDPKAVTPVNPVWRSPTDHSHQVGNDRLVAVASNYGYVQVRQDEGGPKFLNDYDPERGQYGGGLGYLADGQTFLSTFYPGHGEEFERVFGMGYLRKRVTGGGYTVDQVLFAPFGDDPLLISQVTVANNRPAPADVRWIEYWGCQTYPLSYRATMMGYLKRDIGVAAELRRRFAGRFAHRFHTVEEGGGLLAEHQFRGWGLADRARWGAVQAALATVGRGIFGGPVKTPVREASLEDLHPPPTFAVSLDAPADGMATDGRQFFGRGGVARPDGLEVPLPGSLSATGPESAFLLERRFRLEPGESRTLYFAFGYLPQGFELRSTLSGYREAGLSQLWSRSSAAWKNERIRLTFPPSFSSGASERSADEVWVDRELAWHHYYLRSNLTYDRFFQEHILSQGHVYQYVIGFQGAARDPLQHALPFLFGQPEIVRQVLRYTLKEVQRDGEIPYGIVGNGMIMPAPYRPSDQEMWLLWLASEYVLATRDRAFLQERIATYPLYGRHVTQERVQDLLARCYHHLVEVTGTGRHGLQRLSNGDWNDSVIVGHVPAERHREVRQHAESVLNAAMAAYVLDLYAQMLTYVGDTELAADARQKAQAQGEAVRAQWTGRWFRRAWLTPDLGWIGDEQMWLGPQPWAIIGGAATPEQRETLVRSIDDLVRQPSPIGAMLHSRGVAGMEAGIGILTNGGVWPSINGTLIWALALVNGEMAWEEWKKNTLAAHAEAYPEVWYGIWSGPDSYNSTLSRHPGQTMFDESLLTGELPEGKRSLGGMNWTDFPVMNMHPHAWPLYTIAKLVGVAFTPQGVQFTPSLPKRAYRFASPLVGLEKSAKGYAGWYAPAAAGQWQVTLRLPPEEGDRFTRLEVNGQEQPLHRAEDGALQWTGASAPGQPLRWALV